MFQLTSISSLDGLNNHRVDVQAVPFSIGRQSSADFQLEGAGIWENHASISLNHDGRPLVSIREEASCLLNDEVVQGAHVLKPGDILKIGEVVLRFDLSACPQKSSLLQEGCVYILASAFIITQFICVYLLLEQ
jgi:hypothetical protein